MTYISFKYAITTALFLILAISAKADTENYILDPNHSYILWHVNHFGFSDVSGKWMVTGHLELDENAPEHSKVDVIIKLADLGTGVPELDKRLKSADFFNAAVFPTATFVSDSIERISANTAKIHGILNLHNFSKPIVLEAKLNKLAIYPMTKKKTAGFIATTKLKRSAFGIELYAPNVSDEVNIEIQIEAYKADN